jgi:phage terminase large subunit
MGKFIRAVRGGSSAGKTFGILPVLIDYAAKHPLKEISVVAESIPHLKRGAMKDFIKIMQETSRWNRDGWNASDFKYTFRNGAFIEFFSADNDSKLRGARRDVLYMNEANNLTFHAYTELAVRTKDFCFMDWNPVSEFWFDTELKNDDNVDFITLTWQDNEAAPASAVDFILRAQKKGETSDYWRNWFLVYGLGQVGRLEGVIFSNWTQIANVPPAAKLLAYGQDFGYTNDPAALVALYLHDGELILDELIYRRGLLNTELVREYKRLGVKTNVPIYADAAEPKSIKEISGFGYRIQAADKGKDSVNFGIDLLQAYPIRVTQSSLNLIAELRAYTWEKDRKTGAATNAPQDANNHAIDATRYAAIHVLTSYQPNYKSKSIGRTKKPTRGDHYKEFI